MSEATAFQPLKVGDFLVILVKRKKMQGDPPREHTLEYYGLGRVLSVDLRGACTAYEGWNGERYVVSEVAPAQTWAVDALTVAGGAMWNAWKAREGRPFVTLEGITAFVRDFRLRSLAT